MDNYLLVRVFLIILACATLFVLVQRYTHRQKIAQSEKFFETVDKSLQPLIQAGGIDKATAGQVQPNESADGEDFKAVDFSGQEQVGSCFPRDKLTAEDLLPKDAANSKWAQLNPAGQGSVADVNFLQAGHHVGLNTTQGVKRNGNLSIRSEPINPRQNVGPWLQSTQTADTQRRILEIGTDCE